MGRVVFRLPDIGEGIAEAEIVAWHAKIGDHVEEDGPLVDMMTDKATVEMPSPVTGTLVEIAGAVGDQIAIGSALATFETEADAQETPSEEEAPAHRDAPEPPSKYPAKQEPFVPSAVEGRAKNNAPTACASTSLSTNGEAAGPETNRSLARAKDAKVLASPAVRARAKDLGVDLAQVQPAQDGRIRHADLDAYLRYAEHAPAARTRAPAGENEIEEIKIVGLRRRIAANMAEAKRTIPHFAYVEEVDVTALEALRLAMNEERGQRLKLTLLPFLITAIARALPRFPMINARFDDEAGVVRRHSAVHLGMATQTEAGLTVPVIRDAQAKDVWTLAAEIARLAEGARASSLPRDELSGSTITLTSLGALGGIVSTPVINKPEVAIVGVNKIVERPVVIEGRIEVRKMMNLSSSFDHRVVDGMDAARFIQAVKRLIEVPALMFAG
ncbi:MAG: 2-oxo acid dehydrogenase subunit E2 [Sphingomonadaceae bacterium]|nr:2-oxo acid dehydrogenase subunit E2 [Sphingomonadaceae bacterium]